MNIHIFCVSKLSECLKQVPSTTQVTHDFFFKKNKFKRKFKQWKQIEKEVPRDNKPTCNFEGSKQTGGQKKEENLKQ
jgi:hypothetical protein